MVFNATFNNISVISWRSVLLVEETRVPGETHPPVASHWQTLSHKVLSTTYTTPLTGFELTTLVVIGTDCTGNCISNYHTITTTTAPRRLFIWYRWCRLMTKQDGLSTQEDGLSRQECNLSTQNRWSLNTRGWSLKTKHVVSQDKAGGLSTRGWSLNTK